MKQRKSEKGKKDYENQALEASDSSDRKKLVNYSTKSSLKCFLTLLLCIFALYIFYSLKYGRPRSITTLSVLEKEAKLDNLLKKLDEQKAAIGEEAKMEDIKDTTTTTTTTTPTTTTTADVKKEKEPEKEQFDGDDLEKLTPNGIPLKDDIHIVISSGCHGSQHWQSEVFMHSWYRLKHPGKITRLASGCPNEKEEENAKKTAVPGANVVITPDFQNIGRDGKPSHFWNKPYGMYYWLNNTDIKERVIVLVDPDMILTQQFDVHLPSAGKLYVREGHPVAQLYGVGCRWNEWGFCKEKGCELTCREAWNEYSAGPPYIMHINDWKRHAPWWTHYSQLARKHDPWPGIMYEMFGYSLAAAHLNLKHQLPKKWMLSSLNIKPKHDIELWEDLHNPDLTLPQSSCPLFHYCHGYYLGGVARSSPRQGGFNWHKGHVPRDILQNCDMPLLAEVPTGKKAHDKDADETKRNIFMLHWIIKYFNYGVAAWREKFCESGWNNTKTVFLQQPSPRSWYIPGDTVPWNEHHPPIGN